jgi:hypothetical protein
MNRTFSLTLVPLALAFLVSNVDGETVTLFSNFAPDEDHAFNNQVGWGVGTNEGPLPPIMFNARTAVRIDITGGDYLLDMVDAGLMWSAGTPNVGATLTLYADDGTNGSGGTGLPGTALGFASVPQTPLSPDTGFDPLPFTTFDFSSQNLLLEDGHSYWLGMASNTNSNVVLWGLNLIGQTTTTHPEYLAYSNANYTQNQWVYQEPGWTLPSVRVHGTVVPEPCPADTVSSATFQPPPDGSVDAADLAYLLGDWGPNPGSLADMVTSATFQPPPDGVVDAADLAYLLGAWGNCSEAQMSTSQNVKRSKPEKASRPQSSN